MPSHEYQNICLAILGASGVGKTTLLKMFNPACIPEIQTTTEHTYSLPKTLIDGVPFLVSLYECGGAYRELQDQAINQHDGFILVYDAGDLQTLDDVKDLAQRLAKRWKCMISLPALVFCNEKDEDEIEDKLTGRGLGEEVAQQYGFVFDHGSAAAFERPQELLEGLMRRVMGHRAPTAVVPRDDRSPSAWIGQVAGIFKWLPMLGNCLGIR